MFTQILLSIEIDWYSN